MSPRDHGQAAQRAAAAASSSNGEVEGRAGNGQPDGSAEAEGDAEWHLDPPDGDDEVLIYDSSTTDSDRDDTSADRGDGPAAPYARAGRAGEGGRAVAGDDLGDPAATSATAGRAVGDSDEESGAAGGAPDGRADDEMDAFFPSVARAAATGQDIGAILDEELLVKALAERDEYLDALRRLQADFDNFRKRTERQLAEVRSRASESLLERLLPVLDALDLALAHLGPHAGAAAAGSSAQAGNSVAGKGVQPSGDGGSGGAAPGGEHAGTAPSAAQSGDEALTALAQVGSLLRDTLAKEGLERIDDVGVPFDPTVHDAVAQAPEPSGDDEEGGDSSGAVVDEVLRAGYLLKGRVLRPAMVQVRG